MFHILNHKFPKIFYKRCVVLSGFAFILCMYFFHTFIPLDYSKRSVKLFHQSTHSCIKVKTFSHNKVFGFPLMIEPHFLIKLVSLSFIYVLGVCYLLIFYGDDDEDDNGINLVAIIFCLLHFCGVSSIICETGDKTSEKE